MSRLPTRLQRFVKTTAKGHLVPGRYLTRRIRRQQQGVRREAGVPQLARSFVADHGLVVRGGPFAGLQYPASRIDQIDAPVAKLLGAYEAELHGTLSEALLARPSTFVDIGAADGYYAVGFALRSPQTVVHAFEVDAWARSGLRELAALNGVANRVAARGGCTAESMRSLDTTDAFVLSDCEGAEVEIFSDDVARGLETSTVVIELHDERLAYDVLSVLQPRFAETHTTTEITKAIRDPTAFPELASLPEGQRHLALEEFRGGVMRWAVFKPRAAASGTS